ncbi:hypothetical protein B0H67DRAFT_499836 [Lasiosphaeris hirsuta]|uniref:Uncharacterized protein n=1 Tax=Lasiosphaeris hirsuta TaxID=260670 RepID=A0AA40DJY8_9PEZI|nr:hypothetical protein B0H67DRAFT_499836 [Lasiosphaeris hirsuta]
MSSQYLVLFISATTCTGAPLINKVYANLTLTTPTVANLTGTLVQVEDPDEADGDFKKSVHLSTALAGMVLLLFLQSHIRSHGYRLGRSFWASSDNLIWVGLGVVSGFWTLLVFLSAWEWEYQGATPCRVDPLGWKCAGRLAFVPIREMEPFNNWAEPIVVYLLLMGPVVWTSICALRNNLHTLGMLSLAAGVILFHTLQDYPFHLDLPHRCCMDDIRIALPTKLEYGIVYVLPSRWHGFKAVYSPKLDSEHADLEAQRHLFEPLDSVLDDNNSAERWTLGKCRNAIRRVIDTRIQLIEEDEKMLEDLARWLYCHRYIPAKIRKWPLPPLVDGGYVRRGDTKTLIGRDVAMALLLWETLVFRWRYSLYDREEKGKENPSRKLPEPSKSKRGKYDKAKRIGGLLDAVREVYRLLGQEPSPLKVPKRSILLGKIPTGMKMQTYASEVWKRCWEAYPCTFGALCLWTTVWYFDMGNNQGLHTTPLVPAGELRGFRSYGPDYMSTWRMQWRHTWHTAVICQLVIMLPTVISTFFSVMPMG